MNELFNKEPLKQLSNEDFKMYQARLYKNRKEYGITSKELCEYFNELEGRILGESTRRCNTTTWNEGFDYGYKEAIKDKDGNVIIDKLEEKKREIELLKIQFQDQKREYRNYLRADARLEHIKDTIVKEIQIVNKNEPLTIQNKKNINGKNHAVILLSDWHLGIEINNHWNKFNMEIAKKRISELLTKTIKYCKRHEVDTVHVELQGDIINGYLHIGSRVSNEEDVISQTMMASEILSEFINELANNFNNIKVYASTGNHGRCSANIKESIESENFEFMITWYCEARVNRSNVQFVKNSIDKNIVVYKFLNETIFSVHGNLDKVGDVVDDLTKMLKIFPTEVHMGHTHAHYEKEEYDMEVVVNGTLSGTDEFAKSIRKTGTPMQKLMIYNEDGKECTYKIKL